MYNPEVASVKLYARPVEGLRALIDLNEPLSSTCNTRRSKRCCSPRPSTGARLSSRTRCR